MTLNQSERKVQKSQTWRLVIFKSSLQICSMDVKIYSSICSNKPGYPALPGSGESLRHFTTLFTYDFDLGLGSTK